MKKYIGFIIGCFFLFGFQYLGIPTALSTDAIVESLFIVTNSASSDLFIFFHKDPFLHFNTLIDFFIIVLNYIAVEILSLSLFVSCEFFYTIV